MNFYSQEDYKKYISPNCVENEIEYMVNNYLRKRDKKVYDEALFKIEF